MATTLDGLKTYYANVMRLGAASIPATDLATLASLSVQVEGGQLNLAAAQAQVARLAAGTTSVAEIAYAFFTGSTPMAAGLDYLVSPTGGNPNNLNSAYYQSFGTENRYINFAVNLGKLGEGQAAFTAGYGALTLPQALAKAYAEIFGAAPDQTKIDAILNAPVPNGLGGTYARADYFASYGRDGANGIGTKAAMVGWLMTEAVKAGAGPYAQANDAFLADLGPDGTASFNTNLLATYAPRPASGGISFTSGQSVSPSATDAALRSSDAADRVAGTDLDVTQSILTAGGDDVVVASGIINGLIDSGAGNDAVTIGTLGVHVALPNAPDTGTVRLGAGNDTLTISTRLAASAVVDGGEGDDTLTAAISELSPGFAVPTIRNIEHVVFTGIDIPNQAPLNLSGAGSTYKDITLKGAGNLSMVEIPQDASLRLENFTSGSLNAVYTLQEVRVPIFPFVAYIQPDHIDLYLNNVRVASGAEVNFTTNVGRVFVHVESDSVLTSLQRVSTISGPGRLTTALDGGFDASQSGGVEITRNRGLSSSTVLSAFNDKIALDLSQALSISALTLGGGADIVSLYQGAAFANMAAVNGSVTGYLRITDFAKGTDHLVLGGAVPSLLVMTSAVGAAASLNQAVANVSAQLASNVTGVFEYAGDTYVYRQDASAGISAGDGLIQLVGVSGLSVGTGVEADIRFS